MMNPLFDTLNGWFFDLGIAERYVTLLTTLVLVGFSLGVASIAYGICRRYINPVLEKIVTKTDFKWDDILFHKGFILWVWRLIFTLVLNFTLPTAFEAYPAAREWATDLCAIIVILTAMEVVVEFISGAFLLLTSRHDKRPDDDSGSMTDSPEDAAHSLKGLRQMLQLIVICIAIILILSILLGKNPLIILSGLGASAAVLMLVFKDSILGLVAGIQLTVNDMLRPGDWISAPKYGVNGVVRDVTLTTVKVQNFDNTIVTIPPYALVSDAFQNWRGMKDSGGRRVMRSFNIDMTSIRFCTPEEIKEWSSEPWGEGIAKDTVNLTAFRHFLEYYLTHCPLRRAEELVMARELQPTAQGLPIEIYMFLIHTDWAPYESAQADILDYVIASVSRFGLRIFQSPTGADLRYAWDQALMPVSRHT